MKRRITSIALLMFVMISMGSFAHAERARAKIFNIKISYPGHGTEEDAKRIVPEDEDRYPEQFFFGVLPAWGAYIRHAKNIGIKNVEMTLRGSDARQKIVLDDVEGFVEN